MAERDRPIRKVWENSNSGQKLVTVPQDSDIEPGDYVRLEKVEDDGDTG